MEYFSRQRTINNNYSNLVGFSWADAAQEGRPFSRNDFRLCTRVGSCKTCSLSSKRVGEMGNEGYEVPEDANESCPGTQSASAGKADACEGCPNQEACAIAPKGPDPDLQVRFSMERIESSHYLCLVRDVHMWLTQEKETRRHVTPWEKRIVRNGSSSKHHLTFLSLSDGAAKSVYVLQQKPELLEDMEGWISKINRSFIGPTPPSYSLWMDVKKTRKSESQFKLDIGEFCATISSIQEDNSTPMTQGGTTS